MISLPLILQTIFSLHHFCSINISYFFKCLRFSERNARHEYKRTLFLFPCHNMLVKLTDSQHSMHKSSFLFVCVFAAAAWNSNVSEEKCRRGKNFKQKNNAITTNAYAFGSRKKSTKTMLHILLLVK